MAASRQLRLLLWKDYLIRKRNPITLAGVVWGTVVIMSLYIVRINVDNQDYPTCQFPARALPTAGVMNFLQSFICSVNNECSPMEEYEEIPSYSKSKLTQIKQQFAPLFSNSSILETASSMPDALKLLATVSEVADVPDFVYIAKHGLRVKELFRNPDRVKRYLQIEIEIEEPLANSLMDSALSFEGIMQGKFNTCDIDSMTKTIKMDKNNMEMFVQKICSLSSSSIQKLTMDLLLEMDLGKYLQMLGNMYYKLSKDERMLDLGKMAGAVLRMASLQSFLPPEVTEILHNETPDFTYIQLDVISNVLDYFEPNFGDTQSFKFIRDFADSAVMVVKYLNKFLEKQRIKSFGTNNEQSTYSVKEENKLRSTVNGVSNIFSNAKEAFQDLTDNSVSIDIFNVLSRITNFIYKLLPDKTKHDVLFYSTLVTKLIEEAEKVIYINVHLEELMYNVTLRHPQGMEAVLSLPAHIFEKSLEALSDPERAQILTSKLDSPGEVFCDKRKLQKFFEIDVAEVAELHNKMCKDSLKEYLKDMIHSLGILSVRSSINAMASLFIQETLGKDTNSQLYSLDHDFDVLRNFSRTINNLDDEEPRHVNWSNVIDVNTNSDIVNIIRNKKHVGNHILVTVHGALAKAVVKQNPVLEYKIAPFLIDATTIIEALNKDIDNTPLEVAEKAKILYPVVLTTILTTALEQQKLFKLLTTFSLDSMCRGVVTASKYLEFPPDVNKEEVVTTLCNISDVFENVLKRDSNLGKAIKLIITGGGKTSGIQWTKLIEGLRNLYKKIDNFYPYLLEYKSYGMNEEMRRNVANMIKEVKKFWFSPRNWSMTLSMKLAFEILDLMDRDIFDITSDVWLQFKYGLGVITGPMLLIDDVVKLIQAILKNETITSPLPSDTVASLKQVIPYFPQLLHETVDLVARDDTKIEPIIEIMNANKSWPCSDTSLGDILKLTNSSKETVRGIESLLCMSQSTQNEWNLYLKSKYIFRDQSNLNSKDFGPHIFLRFSGAFDSFIEDFDIIKNILLDALDEPADSVTLMTAWRHAVDVLNNTQSVPILRNLFTKMDVVLNSIRVPVKSGTPLVSLWRSLLNCEGDCSDLARTTVLNILKFLSLTVSNVADDLLSYFKEINEPDANLLQLVGFTKKTSLYLLYERLPDFIGVLANSFVDFGFMSQIRRATQSTFWDCEAVVKSLVPAPGGPIDQDIIARVQPFVCPSFLYWISLPRGDNVIMDVVAKPQYYFFTSSVDDLNSTFESAYNKANELSTFMTELAHNKSNIKENINIDSMREKLIKSVDIMLNYKIDNSNPSYLMFNEANKKLLISTTYLTRIVTIINKVLDKIENVSVQVPNENEDKLKAMKDDISALKKIFKRRPTDGTAVFFDTITNNLLNNEENKLTNAFVETCNRLKNNDTTKDILIDNDKVKAQICQMNYDVIFSMVDTESDLENARLSLRHLVNVLRKDEEDVDDISKFLKSRKEIIKSWKLSIKYAYDLGIPVYLKYLHNNVQHQDVIITFLSGGNWWKKLRELYNGPFATTFLNNVEKIFDIADDILNNLDKIRWVRLIREINVNSKEDFCKSNVSMSEYIPDETGSLDSFKQQFCLDDTTELVKELMPLRFASQVFDSNLKISTDVNYTEINIDITRIESNLDKIINGPNPPQTPEWVTENKLKRFRSSAVALLSTETLTKASFGILANIVDAGTLLLNNSQCTLCSQFTTWFKQLNLQLYKKQEYDNLLCHLQDMDLVNVYHTLKNDFHWDMAIKELISFRNYTKFELNKSMNEFLELVKQHLLEDIMSPTTKISQCLTYNVTKNAFGNATLFAKVVAHTFKLIRAELPHLKEVDGIKEVEYLKDLQAAVAHRLDVKVPLKSYFSKGFDVTKNLKEIIKKEYLVKAVEDSKVSVQAINDLQPDDLIFKRNETWQDLCESCDCNKVINIIVNNLNRTLIDEDLPMLQDEEFWSFKFISNILEHFEALVGDVARLLGVVSTMDVWGVAQGRLVAIIDTAIQLLTDDTLGSIVYSLHGLTTELTPLIKAYDLQSNLLDVSRGLLVLQQIRNSLIEEDIKVPVSELFSDPEELEVELSALGINNTNFWSVAAPRIHAGHLQFKPILASKDTFHIRQLVCETEDLARVLVPANLDVVTLDDVLGALAEQFCDLDEDTAKKIVSVLLQNLDYSYFINNIKDWLLRELYAASDLPAQRGELVLDSFPQLAALLPTVRDSFERVSGLLADEPVLDYFKKDFSFDSLFGGGEFMAAAGRMVCGKPFNTQINRFFKSVVETKDLSSEADAEQLEVLPTDFCRSMYKQIVSVDGGKIVWSFVKPLVMGKILYTPVTPNVHHIIQKFSSSSAHYRGGLAALQQLLAAPATQAIKTELFGDVQIPEFDVEEIFNKLGDVQDLGSILQKGSNILECVNLNRFRPVSDEHQLSLEAVKLLRVNEFSAGLVFLNNESSLEVPLNVEYKIRMDIENVPTTSRKKNYLWIPGPESNFIDNMRYFRGFIQIQDIIDKAIIDVAADGLGKTLDVDWATYTQQEPYPCYRKDFFQTSIYESQSLIVAFFFSLLFTTTSVVRFIISEKESGNTVLMSVMGVNLSYHTLSWFLWSLGELVATAACIAAVLCAGGILPHTAPSLIFALLFLFAFSVLSFCYMMSKLFRGASVGAVCSGLAYLISFMPFVLILSLEAVLTSSLKFIVCLSMSSSLCYAFLYITRYEAMGSGAQWAQLWASPDGVDDMSIGLAALIMVLDGILYILIGLLLERLYGFKAHQVSVVDCEAAGEKAGVSVLNVSKVYGGGKLALDNCSLELHTGQITSLLGHNGAGKSTLINIMTGMLKPTRGSVVVRCGGGGAAGARLGVCPQRDVLYRQLSAREHVQLYAQLKSGRDLHELHDQIESILRVLSLGAVAEEPVWRLSGGTRRRLCVALAFVAEPGLVVLDEPTAGVDPAARRDIWSMILKLRENRTILLTTHHLDEAELLSDQIVIMHKGQIHTTGSPIEIKRSLGSGYKLTVMYPETRRRLNEVCDIVEDEEGCIEEKTKLLLATVRNVIRNANLMDVNGSEVEINLPFFDQDGVSSNYLELCLALESQQSALGFCDFSLDCSSLEQVFFTICHQADAPLQNVELDTPSKSASTSSLRNDKAPLVPREGPLVGSMWDQFLALLYARYLHYTRNRSLLFMLVALPSLFVLISMAFSNIRPPPNSEVALPLYRIYDNATEYLVKKPSISDDSVISSLFAQDIMNTLIAEKRARNWTDEDNPVCNCVVTKQECDLSSVNITNLPELMLLPDTTALNNWIVASHDVYIEKRYGGYSSVIKNNISNLVVWYNNKGYHAMPMYLSALHSAVLRAASGRLSANITTYTHPLKISDEPINKDTVSVPPADFVIIVSKIKGHIDFISGTKFNGCDVYYQHIADAGVSAMLLIAFSLASAGGAVRLVTARASHQQRLQLLAGVTPALYWLTALVWDMMVIIVNIIITAAVLQAFHFPVFVSRNNLPAICLLIFLYGYGCAGVVHVASRLFTQPSLANMILFCANTFVGVVGIALLLILDIISESDATDRARWVLHKIFMLSPQFTLGDGVLEIAKNTIRAQVLGQFGMETYQDPLSSDLIAYHYLALVLVGTVLHLLNLAIEYDCFEVLLAK
ncbi:ATP-binding cassette sub-family A member 12 [Papilio machaon]|uniref:ATP-binding cassette sub-family A member 12 n=1 Tax=Papilio machaon TaxID=76193 RepID=A0A0N1IEN2_PAPMA|nr:ATP-binding cassette sub-family A member 12 [Papilio machaon]